MFRVCHFHGFTFENPINHIMTAICLKWKWRTGGKKNHELTGLKHNDREHLWTHCFSIKAVLSESGYWVRTCAFVTVAKSWDRTGAKWIWLDNIHGALPSRAAGDRIRLLLVGRKGRITPHQSEAKAEAMEPIRVWRWHTQINIISRRWLDKWSKSMQVYRLTSAPELCGHPVALITSLFQVRF